MVAFRLLLLFVMLWFVLLFVFLVDLFLFLFLSRSVSLPGADVLCWLLSRPLSSVCFPCFSPNAYPV